jgi:hypothetical protein
MEIIESNTDSYTINHATLWNMIQLQLMHGQQSTCDASDSSAEAQLPTVTHNKNTHRSVSETLPWRFSSHQLFLFPFFFTAKYNVCIVTETKSCPTKRAEYVFTVMEMGFKNSSKYLLSQERQTTGSTDHRLLRNTV